MNEIDKFSSIEKSTAIAYHRGDIIDPLRAALKPPEGYTYKWLRTGLESKDDTISEMVKYADAENFKAHERGGWELVPHARHPEMPNLNGTIFYRNNLLVQYRIGLDLPESTESLEKRRRDAGYAGTNPYKF